MTEQKKLIVPNEEEKIIQIEIERLTTFKDHPFKVGDEFMRPVEFDENELMLMAIFAEKTKQETIDTLKDTLELLEEPTENVPDEEMIEMVSTLIEKLQQIEDKYFYALEFDNYVQEMEDYGDVD